MQIRGVFADQLGIYSFIGLLEGKFNCTQSRECAVELYMGSESMNIDVEFRAVRTEVLACLDARGHVNSTGWPPQRRNRL